MISLTPSSASPGTSDQTYATTSPTTSKSRLRSTFTRTARDEGGCRRWVPQWGLQEAHRVPAAGIVRIEERIQVARTHVGDTEELPKESLNDWFLLAKKESFLRRILSSNDHIGIEEQLLLQCNVIIAFAGNLDCLFMWNRLHFMNNFIFANHQIANEEH